MLDSAAIGQYFRKRPNIDVVVLVLAAVALAVPTMAKLADQEWSTEAGSAGPIILFSGAWLLWRRIAEFRKLGSPGRAWATASLLAVSLVSYIVGSMTDLITFEAGGLYGVGLTMLYSEFGSAPILRNWFPFAYLAFLVPMPKWMVENVTIPLKQLATVVSSDLLSAFGLPVSHSGVAIYVAQYQLFVADACSGMNSIFGLIAITLFYVYLRNNASKRYVIFLASLAIPIAVISNILRICILVLLTYYAGDETAQGFLHGTAGIFTFVSALLFMMGIDWLATSIFAKRTQGP